MRCFEQPACRAFSLVSRTGPILEIFKEGNTIECFETVDEAKDKIRFYLTHESQRIKVANQAHDLIMGSHTYVDRAKTIIKWMSTKGAI
jgi:spore maturation protein CgeB